MELSSNNKIIKNKINKKKINKRNENDKGMQTLLPQPPFRKRNKRNRNRNKNNDNNNGNQQLLVNYSDSDDNMKNMNDGRGVPLPNSDDEDNNDKNEKKEEKNENKKEEKDDEEENEIQKALVARDGAYDINGNLVPAIGKARYFNIKKKTHWSDRRRKQQQQQQYNDKNDLNNNENEEKKQQQQHHQPNIIRGMNKMVQNEPEYKNEEINKKVKNIVDKFHITKYLKKEEKDINDKYDKDKCGNPYEISAGKYIIKDYNVYDEEEIKYDGGIIVNSFWDCNYYDNPFRKILLDDWNIRRIGNNVCMEIRNDKFDEWIEKKENEKWKEFKLLIVDKEKKRETQECVVEWNPPKLWYPPQKMVLVDVPRWCNRMDRLKELILNGIKRKMRNNILMDELKKIINIDEKYKKLYDIFNEILKDNDGITCHFPTDMLENDKILQNIMKYLNDMMDGMDPNKIITKIDRLYKNQVMNPTKLRMVGLIIEDIPLQYLKNVKIPIGTEYAILQDSSVLSGVIGFLVDIPQCTHCWEIGHKWKWCDKRKKEINNKRILVEKLYNEKKMTKKQRNKELNEFSPKRYCKKCHKKGHNGKECTNIRNLKCGICSGPHESIKCAKCPVIRKLIKLYQKAIIMRDDGVSIKEIKKMNNDSILKYVKGDNGLHHQQLLQSMTSSTIDRGGNNNNNNKNEENKDDMNNDDLSMQSNHNSSANLSSTSITQPTIHTNEDKSLLSAIGSNTNNEIDPHFADNQLQSDDDYITRTNTANGPPPKKRKNNNNNNNTY